MFNGEPGWEGNFGVPLFSVRISNHSLNTSLSFSFKRSMLKSPIIIASALLFSNDSSIGVISFMNCLYLSLMPFGGLYIFAT